VELYTIGFTKKSASDFFGALRSAGVRRLVDARLSNSSQLAGFTKQADLPFFLRELCNAEYVHEPLLAPTSELRDTYLKRKGSWEDYERGFRALIAGRAIEQRLTPDLFSGPTVLLCAEPTAERCHRRLVAEYLREKWGGLEIVHL
jgi:uncharacterized protein (DUF488 family)